MGMGVMRAANVAARETEIRRETLAIRFVGFRRPLEVDEVLQHRLAERRQSNYHVGRKPAGVEWKIHAAEAWRTAERRGDVPHGGEMAHLLDGHAENLAAPAGRGIGFRGRQAFLFTGLQAEGGVQVGAHQVVLELGGFVQLVYQRFARYRSHVGYGIHAHQYVGMRVLFSNRS